MTTTYYTDGGPGPADHLYRIVGDGEGEEWFMGGWHPAPNARSDIRWSGWLSMTDDVEKAKREVNAHEAKYAPTQPAQVPEH